MTALVRDRLHGAQLPEHVARLLTSDMLKAADLVLVAEHAHLADIGRIVPSVGPRSFTLRRAADLARTIAQQAPSARPQRVRSSVSSGLSGEGPTSPVPAAAPGTPPLPAAEDVEARLQWLVTEMNEARTASLGIVPQPRRAPLIRLRRRQPEVPSTDVPDPHAHRHDIHRDAFAMLADAVDELASGIRDVLAR